MIGKETRIFPVVTESVTFEKKPGFFATIFFIEKT